MKLSNLLAEISFYIKEVPKNFQEDLLIKDIKSNHKEVNNGDLFICIKGNTFDGHQFAKKAERRGAVIIFSEKYVDVSIPVVVLSSTKDALAKIAAVFFKHPSKKLKLFGITGTNGKTTVSYLLNTIFTLQDQGTGVIGTIETKIHNQTFKNKHTTPDVITLQRTLYQMVQEKVQLVFIEVSSHALALGRVHGCEFDVAIFTNLSQDHLDFHKTMENYAYSKSLLFSQLGSSYHGGNKKYVIINKDDKLANFFINSTAQHVLTYGNSSKADLWAKDIHLTNKGSQFTMVTPLGEIQIISPLLVSFNVSNMLASAGAAIVQGVPLELIQKAFKTTVGIPGRFEIVSSESNYTVIVDYAHTPEALEKVLKTIKTFAKGKVFVVVGCGGNRDHSKRFPMAKAAVDHASYAIFTSDNPRFEDPNKIVHQMIDPLKAQNYTVELDRKKAIYLAIRLANNNDIILIAGKGHETYQEIKGVKYDFDDRLVAAEAIHKKEN